MQHTARGDCWYEASASDSRRWPPLRGAVETDVCVVGGGYTGLSSALHLRQRGYSVALLEAGRVGRGASGRNGGHIDSGQRLGQAALEQLVGPQRAAQLWQLGREAVATVLQLIAEHNIDCELRCGNLHLAARPAEAASLRAEVERLQRVYHYSRVQYVPPAQLAGMTSARGCHGGILDRGAHHLHPLNYALGLARAAHQSGAALFEGSRVTGFSRGDPLRVHTDSGEVRARFLVLACNGYLNRLESGMAARILPVNNYMLATAPLDAALARRLVPDDTAMSDSLSIINYWKLSADRRLLFGGGETFSRRYPRDIRDFVRRRMLRIYPELAHTPIDYGWGGTLAITRNRMPDFGRLEGNIFYAQGYSGHGISIATLAGKLLAEVIAGTAERFDVMAAVPSPAFPGGTLLRWPTLAAGTLLYSLRDRLGRQAPPR